MAVSLTHTTVAVGTDAGNGEIAKAQWNENHTLTMATGKVLGRSTAGDGAVEELSELTLTSGTKTASAPVLDMSQTWNNAAVTFTGLKLNVTDTTSAAASLLMDLQVGGASRFQVTKSGSALLRSGAGVSFYRGSDDSLTGTISATSATGSIDISGGFRFAITSGDTGTFYLLGTNRAIQFGTAAGDLQIRRRAAANLQLGAADAAAPVAQTLSVQSVVAGTTNTAGANLTITGSQGTGTGAGGSIIFQVAPAGSTGSAQNALATKMTLGSNGNLDLTNSLSIGFDIYLSRYLVLGASYTATLYSNTSGVVQLSSGTSAGNGFDRLQFGGTTSSFPAIKRSTTVLQARLADDSAFATIQGKLRSDVNAVAETPTATHTITITDAAGTAYKVLCVAA